MISGVISLFRRVFRKSIADSYRYLGLVFFSSIVVSGAGLAGLGLFWLLGLRGPALWLTGGFFVWVFAVPPFVSGAHFVARKAAAQRPMVSDEPSTADLFSGAREFMLPSWALAFVQLLITFVILFGCWFYFSRGTLPFQLLSVLFLYFLFFWLMSSIYHYPILIEQRPGIVKILKRGFLLTIGSPGFTLLVFLVIILIVVLCLISFMIGAMALYAGLTSFVQTYAARELFIKFKAVEPDSEPEADSSGDDDWPVGL